MLRQVVESSSLRSIGYDRATATLEVEFSSGGVYRYADVPPELWSAFRHADSKGRFFQDHVRDRFTTARVSENVPFSMRLLDQTQPICASFSSKVMRNKRSATRAVMGWAESW